MKRHWRFVRLEQLAVITVCAMLFLVGCNLPPVGPIKDAYPIDAQGMINLPGPTGSAPNGEDISGPSKKVSLNDFARQFAECH